MKTPSNNAHLTCAGDVKILQAFAHDVVVHVRDGGSVVLQFSAPCVGKRSTTRTVLHECPGLHDKRPRTLLGHVDGGGQTRFRTVEAAVEWLEAGIPVARADYDDETDYRAAHGIQQFNFRLGEMQGRFDPQEFGTIAWLLSFVGYDYDWLDLDPEDSSAMRRMQRFEEIVAEHDIEATPDDIATARGVYGELVRKHEAMLIRDLERRADANVQAELALLD